MKNTVLRPFACFLLAAASGIAVAAASPSDGGAADGGEGAGSAADAVSATRALAGELVAEGQWAPAALEYRRLALDDPAHEAVWRWMAAWAYAQSPDARVRQRAPRQLDMSEDAASSGDAALDWAIPALRAEWSLRDDDPSAARFHFESAAGADAPDGAPGDWAARGAAVASLFAGEPERARGALAGAPGALASLDARLPMPRKRPWLGGLLGIVPGLGYAYSGEWANATRSFLLNGIFIWAMAQSAHEDQWGVFAACTFLEFTWYSGSIYGGIDAAHRWNDRQLDAAALDLRGPEPFPVPDLAVLPILRLEF